MYELRRLPQLHLFFRPLIAHRGECGSGSMTVWSSSHPSRTSDAGISSQLFPFKDTRTVSFLRYFAIDANNAAAMNERKPHATITAATVYTTLIDVPPFRFLAQALPASHHV